MSSWYGGENFSEVLSDDEEGKNWFVTRTRSRCEKKIADDCLDSKVRYYLPMYKKEGRSHRQIVLRDMPLFSGYIFIYADYDNKILIENNRKIAALYPVSFAQTKQFLSELINVEKALQVSRCVTPTTNLLVGQKVRVVKGSLEGIEGEIIRIKNKWQLILKASMIGQAAIIEIDADTVEKQVKVLA